MSDSFYCGNIRYRLRNPWNPHKISSLSASFHLDREGLIEEIEREIHFRFQSLFRKLIDDWTAYDFAEWKLLDRIINTDEYIYDNPTFQNRIGKIISIDKQKVKIEWNSDGLEQYDSKMVPPGLLVGKIGDIVSAEVIVKDKVITWLTVKIEPPYIKSENEWEDSPCESVFEIFGNRIRFEYGDLVFSFICPEQSNITELCANLNRALRCENKPDMVGSPEKEKPMI